MYKELSSKYINITRKDVRDFLIGQNNYQLTFNPHAVVNKPLVEKHPNRRHQVDLIDLSNYVDKRENQTMVINGYTFKLIFFQENVGYEG